MVEIMGNDNQLLLSKLLKSREDYEQSIQEYIDCVEEYCYHDIRGTSVTFRGDKMYLRFQSLSDMHPRFMLRFCETFGFLSPRIEFHELSEYVTSYIYTFIKIIK